jgi:hypothetical protein
MLLRVFHGALFVKNSRRVPRGIFAADIDALSVNAVLAR